MKILGMKTEGPTIFENRTGEDVVILATDAGPFLALFGRDQARWFYAVCAAAVSQALDHDEIAPEIALGCASALKALGYGE